jgi:hypothetical protein
MGGGGSKGGSGFIEEVGRSVAGSVGNLSHKVGEIANNPIVSKVGTVAGIGASLAGHPEIALGIKGVQMGAPIVGDILRDVSGRDKEEKGSGNLERNIEIGRRIKTGKDVFNRESIEKLPSIRRERERELKYKSVGHVLGGDPKTWSPIRTHQYTIQDEMRDGKFIIKNKF